MADQAEVEYQRGTRRMWIWAAVTALVFVVGITLLVVHQQHTKDVRADQFTCTLSGMGPLDRGPRTGALCADLLRDTPGITWGP